MKKIIMLLEDTHEDPRYVDEVLTKALENIDAAIAIDPTCFNAIIIKIRILHYKGKLDEVFRFCEKIFCNTNIRGAICFLYSYPLLKMIDTSRGTFSIRSNPSLFV